MIFVFFMAMSNMLWLEPFNIFFSVINRLMALKLDMWNQVLDIKTSLVDLDLFTARSYMGKC